MRFSRAPQRYGQTPPAETPYQRAGQLWDERLGSARVQAYSWRLAFFGCLGLSAVLAGGNVWQASQSRIVPYVVEVDRLGAPRAVGAAEQDYQPADPVLFAALQRFIVDVRSLSSDPVVVRQRWLDAYDMVTDRGRVFLDGFARSNDPFAAIGERTVSIQPTSVVRATDHSFRVDWVEQTFERGSLAKTERWTGILTLQRVKPRTRDDLRRNPLGLYVESVDWSQQMDARLAPSAAPAAQSIPQPSGQGGVLP